MWLTESVLRRFDNAELIQSLERRVEERTTELKGVNQQLQLDIAERKRTQTALADYGHRQAAIADFGQSPYRRSISIRCSGRLWCWSGID
jgi:C4-dicarboxylate-specific signal transduction histidine kinase